MTQPMKVHGATCICPVHQPCTCGRHRRNCPCGGVLERTAGGKMTCSRDHEVRR